MKKWITRCVTAAALILIVLLVVAHQLHPPGITMGKPLPPGKVRPQLVNAWDSALLLAPDGSLWAWGGTYSSLTNMFPLPTISQVPLRVGSDTDWTQIACGTDHTLALKNDGSLWAWGDNHFGQIGDADLTHHFRIPTRIGTETNWAQICASRNRSLALKNDGSLWAWGLNNMGQLGDGTSNNRSVPTLIGGGRDGRMVAASDINSFALKSNGTLWGWGYSPGNNSYLTPKQIALGTNWLSISAYGPSMLALKTDGTLWVGSFEWPLGYYSGPNEYLSQIGRDRDWTDVYAGVNSFFARKKDGSWWVCGQNVAGQVGSRILNDALPSPRRLSFDFEPWAFAPGMRTTLLLGRDGKLWTWDQRMGAEKPGAARRKIAVWLSPLVNRFPSLGFLIKSGIDQTPHLLWELPSEVQRSLGTEPKSATSNLAAGRAADASHE